MLMHTVIESHSFTVRFCQTNQRNVRSISENDGATKHRAFLSSNCLLKILLVGFSQQLMPSKCKTKSCNFLKCFVRISSHRLRVILKFLARYTGYLCI